MWKLKLWIGAALGVVIASTQVNAGGRGDPCDNPPDLVAGSIARGWSLLRLRDLNPDDQKLWSESRPNTCPGFAPANMGVGTGASYAVAMIQRGRGGTRENVVLLVPQGAHTSTHTLGKPMVVANPAVVWRTGPGKTQAWDGGPSISVAHESIIVETLEAAAEQFYFVGGRLKSVVISN